MSDINQIRKERLLVLRAAQRALKAVDTQVELLQRLLTRLVDRKRKIVTESEFNAIIENSQRLEGLLDDWIKVLRDGLRIFMRVR